MKSFSAVDLPGVTLLTNVPSELIVFMGDAGATVVGSRPDLESWVANRWANKSEVPEIFDYDEE